MDLLVRTMLRKPSLGKVCESLELKLGISDIPGDLNSTSIFRRKQELSLIALLPFIRRVRSVTISASYDCPESFLQLISSILTGVETFALVSAFGYSKLVYVAGEQYNQLGPLSAVLMSSITAKSLANLLINWPELIKISLTMPWLLDDGTRRVEKFTPRAKLRSIEISGFRGEVGELAWLIRANESSLKRFHFDCPLDEERWPDLASSIGAVAGTLVDLSIWSWSYRMPIEDILHTCQGLKTLALAAHDCQPAVLALLPKTLTALLVCSHVDFSSLDPVTIALGLEAHRFDRLASLTLCERR